MRPQQGSHRLQPSINLLGNPVKLYAILMIILTFTGCGYRDRDLEVGAITTELERYKNEYNTDMVPTDEIVSVQVKSHKANKDSTKHLFELRINSKNMQYDYDLVIVMDEFGRYFSGPMPSFGVGGMTQGFTIKVPLK